MLAQETLITDVKIYAQVTYPSIKKDEILELLEQHITDNIVKVGSVSLV